MAENRMKAVVKVKPQVGAALLEVPVPKINEEEVLVKVMAAGLCGSDVHTYLWEESMRYKEAFLPMILGHEFSGQVVQVEIGRASCRERV